MISYLIGIPRIWGTNLVILVGGVGYGVKVTPQLLTTLASQAQAELHIHTHVKEDKLDLYGFATIQEKDTFELLLSVSGIGPATALGLVAAGSHQLIEAVQNAQVSFFTNVPRVGKKLAQKIIIELRGKLGELKTLDLGPKSVKHQEISEALLGLGFDESRIEEVLNTMDLTEIEIQVAIKQAIKALNVN